MKTLFLVILFFSFSVNANSDIENVTCALSKKHFAGTVSEKLKANELLVFNEIGSSFYELKTYHEYNKKYEDSSEGRGIIHELESSSYETLKFHTVNSPWKDKVIDNNMILNIESTTGGYPGAGHPPKTVSEYKCLINYKNVLRVTKKQIIKDFDL